MTKKEIKECVHCMSSYHEQNYNYKDRIAELEAQIEKMKCCENCAKLIDTDQVITKKTDCDNCFDFSNWKLKE